MTLHAGLVCRQWRDVLRAAETLAAALVACFGRQQALYRSIASERIDVLKLLTEWFPEAVNAAVAGEGWHGEDLNGRTVLCEAALNGSLEAVAVLLEAGAEVDKCDNDMATPLIYAAGGGQLDAVLALLAAGADINHNPNDGIFPGALLEASMHEHWAVVLALVERGADPNQWFAGADNIYHSALHLAVIHNELDVVIALIDNNADINELDLKENTPLMCAVSHSSFAVMRELIARGADVNLDNIDGTSPLHSACVVNSLEAVQMLLAKGAMIDRKEVTDGDTPLIRACQDNDSLEIIQALVSAGADVNMMDNQGYTPLLTAVKWAHPEAVELLLSAGARLDLHRHYPNSHSPLFVAAQLGNAALVKVLLDAGDLIDHQVTGGPVEPFDEAGKGDKDGIEGYSPVMIASRLGHCDVVETLLTWPYRAKLELPFTVHGRPCLLSALDIARHFLGAEESLCKRPDLICILSEKWRDVEED